MKFHSDIIDFLSGFTPDACAAVTLNMKQREGGQRLDRIEAQKNFRYFNNILSQKAFGSASRRFGRRLGALPILEVSLGGRLHYHAYLENPFPNIEMLRLAVDNAWQRTRWGYGELKVEPVYSDGWLNYITKSGRFDDIDYENLRRV